MQNIQGSTPPPWEFTFRMEGSNPTLMLGHTWSMRGLAGSHSHRCKKTPIFFLFIHFFQVTLTPTIHKKLQYRISLFTHKNQDTCVQRVCTNDILSSIFPPKDLILLKSHFNEDFWLSHCFGWKFILMPPNTEYPISHTPPKTNTLIFCTISI